MDLTTADGILDLSTLDPSPPPYERSTFAWIMITLLLVSATISFAGNLLVIFALIFDKKLLKVNFNVYILNLAITDLTVSCMGMPFFVLDLYFGRWIFDEVTCAMWIMSDWGMTFASVFFLVAISLDRYWAACWPKSYRAVNMNNKRTKLTAGLVWLAVLIVYIPPFIIDRLRWSEAGACIFSVEKNKDFAIFVGLAGYHLPCCVIVFCYYKVFVVMRRSGAGFTKTKVQPSSEATQSTFDASGSTSSSDPKVQAKKQKAQNAKDKKIFVSLSYIIFSYLLTWIPWHITFDLLLIAPEKVNINFYIFTNWTAFFNSMLNPLMYAASSRDFKTAMKNVCLLKCIRGD